MLKNKHVVVTFVISMAFFLYAKSIDAQKLDRNIHLQTIVNAPIQDVWKAWTTESGLESFLAPDCEVDLRVNGSMDIYFYPEAPEGQRGAENLHILAVENYRLLSFTWNNPAELPGIGNQQTHVLLKLFPAGKSGKKTKLVLIHDGWGDGELWDQAYRYFSKEWQNTVLFRLHYRFDKGPVNWSYPPKNTGKYHILVQ